MIIYNFTNVLIPSILSFPHFCANLLSRSELLLSVPNSLATQNAIEYIRITLLSLELHLRKYYQWMSVCINNENYLSIKVLKADVYVCVNIYNNYKIVPPNFIQKKNK